MLRRVRLFGGSLPYQHYLDSKHWRKTRKEIFKERGEVCEDCGKDRSCGEYNFSLEIHHITYPDDFSEDDGIVKVVCGKCHRKYHKKRPCVSCDYFENFKINLKQKQEDSE